MQNEQIQQASRLGALVQRAGWGVADQALSSLTNFALSIFVARAVGPAGLGSFTIVYATYTTALGISRAVTSEPLLVRYSAPQHDAWRVGTARATGAALVVGLGLGLCCMLVGWIAPGALTRPFIALGLTLPGLLLQDCWRYAFFARGRGFSAFVNDLLWALVVFCVLFMLLRSDRASVTWIALLGWGGAATVAALFGVRQSRVIPAPQRLLDWVREEGNLIPRFLGEFVTLGGAGQFLVYAIGAIIGLAALGSLRAGYLLFGPIQVLYMGVGAIAVPELVRALENSTARLRWTSKLLSFVLAGTALAWGTVVLMLPASVGVAFLGPAWQPARLLAVAVMVGWVGSALVAGAAAGLRALAAARQSLAARLIGSLLAVGGGLVGAVTGGARGAAWGLALAGWIEAVVWWLQYARAVRDRERAVSAELSRCTPLFNDPGMVSHEGSA
jgi:O-antigen/teichoic acid export membrane protein